MKQPMVKKLADLCQPFVKPIAIAILSLGICGQAYAGGTLRIAMTASDIPLPNGQTDQGAEGMRFLGYQVFEALVAYDLSTAEKPVTLVPGLATGWSTDPDDRKKWTFELRDDVKFHDGSAFNADAVVWNLDKILNPESPQYDERQSGQGRGRVPTIESYRAVDDSTVEIVTSIPDALFPFQIAWIVMSSPAAYESAGNWDNFLNAPGRHRPVQGRKLHAARIGRDGPQRRLLER